MLVGLVVGWHLMALRKRGYTARWAPLVTTTDEEAKVYVTKKRIPGRRLVTRDALLLIGTVPADDDSFDTRMTALLDRAAQRAEVLSLEQNTHNRYRSRR